MTALSVCSRAELHPLPPPSPPPHAFPAQDQAMPRLRSACAGLPAATTTTQDAPPPPPLPCSGSSHGSAALSVWRVAGGDNRHTGAPWHHRGDGHAGPGQYTASATAGKWRGTLLGSTGDMGPTY